MLQEMVYTGIGAMALMREKVQEEMKTLEEKGKIKSEDAKSFLKSIEERGKEEDERIKNRVKSMIKEVIDELGLVTKEDLQKAMAKDAS